jgi:hypothetical protein
LLLYKSQTWIINNIDMSSTLSTFELRINSELFESKRRELNHLVGNLKLNDVKEDADFDRTTKRIKNAIILKPVTFQEPKIADHSQIEKDFPPSYQNMFGGRRQVNMITVEFKFDGSPELFNYAPSSYSISGNSRVHQPDYGNSITVDVELPTLDKTLALNSAKDQMKTTFDIIQGNNNQVKQWTISMETTIETVLAAKRKELLDLYN